MHSWLNGWDFRVKLTIHREKVKEDLTDFPVTVYLRSTITGTAPIFSGFSALGAADYYKIAVALPNALQCPVEVERFDIAGGVIVLHFKAPALSSTEDNIFWLYYDSTHADNTDYVGLTGESAAEEVWDDNFLAVWHMAENPGGTAPQLIDSTGNGRDGTSAGTMLVGDLVNSDTGDKAIDFDGTDDRFTIPSLPTDNYPTGMSVEAVIKLTSLTTPRVIFSQGQNFHTSDMFDLRYESNELVVGSRVNNYLDWAEVSVPFTNTTKYHYVIGGYNTDDGELQIGLDGSTYSASACTRYNQYTNSGVIGRQTVPTGYPYIGRIGEVRLSSLMRSEAWSLATYYALMDSNFISFEWENYPLWLRGYKECLQITIDSSSVGIAANLTNYPLALFINSSSGVDNQDLSRVIRLLQTYENRFKIAITDDRGVPCYVEIDQWDVANERAILYVQVPTVYYDRDTVLNFYFDPSVADNTTYVGDTGSTAAQTVWDASFYAVYHMSQASGGFLDSTSNGRDTSEPAGTMTFQAPGENYAEDGNLAWAFSNITSPATATGFPTSMCNGNITFEIYMNPSTVSTSVRQILYTNKGGLRQDNSNYRFQLWRSAAYWTSGEVNNAFTVGWEYYAGAWRNSGDKTDLYKGTSRILYNFDEYYAGYTATTDGNFSIASDNAGVNEMLGSISEVRVSSVDRGINWTKLTALSLKDQALTYTPLTTNYQGSWLPGWRRRAKITIDKDMFAVPEKNYDLVLQLDATTGSSSVDATEIFDDLVDESLKIAFTTSNGHSQCYAEVNSWSSGTETAVATVTVPYISELADTVLYLYWDANIADNTVFVSEYVDTPTPEDVFTIEMGQEHIVPIEEYSKGDAAWLSGFSDRAMFTIDVSDYTEDFSNFPMALILSDDCLGGRDYSHIPIALGANPYKIAVTLADGTTQCYVENSYLDSVNGVMELYFKISLASTDTLVTVYLYFDSAAANNTTYVGVSGDVASRNVWDANYAKVIHFSQDPTGGANAIKDSKTATHGTAYSAESEDLVEGWHKVRAYDSDAVAEYIDLPSTYFRAADKDAQGTVEAVVKRVTGRTQILSQDADGVNNCDYGMFYIHETTNVLALYSRKYTGGSYTSSSVGTVGFDSQFHYVATAFYMPSQNVDFMIDGVWEDNIAPHAQGNDYSSNYRLDCNVGRFRSSAITYYAGVYSELRVSTNVRSRQWLDLTRESLIGSIYGLEQYSAVAPPEWIKFNDIRPCKRLQMTIRADDVPVELTNYDLQVSVNYNRLAGTTDADTSGFWQEMDEGGGYRSVVFTIEDGTVLEARNSDFDMVDKEATYWVTVPSISDSEDTVLLLYYDHTVTNTDITSGAAGTPNDLVEFGPEEGWLSAYDKRLMVFCTPSAQDLYDFPIPLKLNAVTGAGKLLQTVPLEVLAHAGNSFAVTLYDGRTQCYCELEVAATPDSYESILWVAIRHYSKYGTHFFYYYSSLWENPFIGSEYTWDKNYLSVHHMGEDPSGTPPQLLDSTENDYDGTTEGTMLTEDSVAGNIGQSLDLDGTDDAVSLGTGGHGDLITVEAIIKNTDTSNIRAIVSKDDETAREFYFRQTADGKLEMVAFTADLTSGATVGGTTIGDGQYHHVVGVFDGTNVRVYVDGEEDNASPTALAGVIQTDDTAIYIGKLPWATPVYGIGQIEEVRVSRVARSAVWVSTSHAALFDSLLTFGEWTTDDPSLLKFPVLTSGQVFRTPSSVQVSVNGVWRYVVRVQVALNGAWKDLT